MDPSRFDTLARSIAQTGTRRWLLPRLAAASLLGVLAAGDQEAGAERPSNRLQRRSKQRNKKQRNKRHRNKNNNNGGGGGGGLGDPEACLSNGNICAQDSDCCSSNCFNFVCAKRVTRCSDTAATRQCVPPAKGCAGGACCYGAAACGDTCCEGQANQCNPQGACCVPNCSGRSCGPDGCGAGGTCGNCPSSQTCNETTGQCHGASTCNAQSCPNGCCDAEGTCQTGTSGQACGTNGVACQTCPTGQTCLDGACRGVAGTCVGGEATCGKNTHIPCNGTDSCSCDITTDGAEVCRRFNTQCSTCASNADCGPGSVCIACQECRPSARACAPLC